MSSRSLHHALLRPAIIHILRAAGFHSTRPSVLDALTDLCARYLILLASQTTQLLYHRTSGSASTNDAAYGPSLSTAHQCAVTMMSKLDNALPTVSDVRLALKSASFFASTVTSAEEAWQETLRKPLNALPAAAQEKERHRRDAEDTRDVREFIDWAIGPVNREIRRIAGLINDEQSGGYGVGGVSLTGNTLGDLADEDKEDYLSVLKKKHSKTGDVARYAGTALGKLGEDKGPPKIEGGPPTLAEFGVKRALQADVEQDARGAIKKHNRA